MDKLIYLNKIEQRRINMELKAIESATAVIGNVHLVYPKDEADKVIAEKDKEIEVQKRLRDMALSSVPNVLKVMKIIQRHKYKRCLAMSHICYKNSIACANYTMPHEKYKHWRRWQTIWSEIANKFKEAK